MKMLKLYEWIAGSMTDFTRPFRDNETLFAQAKSFWRALESSSILLLVTFLVLGIAIAAYYYTAYNNKPGRHYKPVKWALFLAVAAIATFLVTFGIEYAIAQPKLQGAMMLETRIALGNAIYAAALYFIVSVLWCNALPTNACRIFKF